MGGLSDNDTFTSDILSGGVQSELIIGVTAVEGRVGALVLSNRKYVMFQAREQGIFYGMDSGVTTANGIEIFKNQLLMIPIGESGKIYFIATGAGKALRFQEAS